MNLASLATSTAERLDLPDVLLRAGIANMVGRSARGLAASAEADDNFALWMTDKPIALHPAAANGQHYELPAAFFDIVLGEHRKYSSCLFTRGDETLAAAEANALNVSCRMAALQDGQRILELGCGWGALTLHMAAAYPNADITAVSNSASQRAHIEAQIAARGMSNVRVFTADMNDFAPGTQYDRVVSVEMFEHMANWRALLARIRGWLLPQGRLFLHVFAHVSTAYRFDHEHGADWIAQHFFTGGIMPSRGLIRQFGDLFSVEAEQHWSGTHYERTAMLWLENFDRNRTAVDRLLRETYGADADIWRRRWRLFFLAVAGLFGHANGDVWGVAQYRLQMA
jgi:cyclopropane-fatty-acyl-phospholipid synthase